MVHYGDYFNIKRVSSLGFCIKELPCILYHGFQSIQELFGTVGRFEDFNENTPSTS
jgi:hypothetical protein